MNGKNPARVLVQINGVGLGGTEINALDLAAGVASHGYSCVIAAPKDTLPSGPSLLDLAAIRGVEVELFERPKTTMQGALILNGLAARHAIDLVHVYGSWSSRPAYWGPCFLGRRPLVMTIYEMKLNADTAAIGPELIVGTGYLLDSVHGRQGGVHLISPPVDLDENGPNAVDPGDFMKRFGISPTRPKVALVSRLDRDLKALSVEHSIKAADRLASTGIQLVVVGTGDSEASLRALAAEVNDRHGRAIIVMTGAVSDPRPAYSCADIVIGMGGSAARGLAFGKPLIVAGEFGWFMPFNPANDRLLFRNSFWSDELADDPIAQLAEALATLISSRETRVSLGSHGRNFATQHFGLKDMSAKLAGIYGLARASYGPARWLSDMPIEAGFLTRRFTSRRGYRPLFLHSPTGLAAKVTKNGDSERPA